MDFFLIAKKDNGKVESACCIILLTQYQFFSTVFADSMLTQNQPRTQSDLKEESFLTPSQPPDHDLKQLTKAMLSSQYLQFLPVHIFKVESMSGSEVSVWLVFSFALYCEFCVHTLCPQ